MDDIRPPQPRYRARPDRAVAARPMQRQGRAVYQTARHPRQAVAPADAPQLASGTPEPEITPAKLVSVQIRLPKLETSKLHVPKWVRRIRSMIRFPRSTRMRLSFGGLALLMLASAIITVVQPMFVEYTYAMDSGGSLLPEKDSFLAGKLKLDTQKGVFNYNQGFTPTNATTDSTSGGPQITAVLNQDLSKGITVTDPLNKTDFTMKPQFKTYPGKQDGNRVLYPLSDGTGWVVYSMQATQIKEDVILDHANGDTMKLAYDMDLTSQGLEARKQTDGSIGVYGSSLPVTGNVSTGNAKDAALLQKARAKAKKDKLLFSLPAPVVYQKKNVVAKRVVTTYDLDGQKLTSRTTGLRHAAFPLDVDPAVTVLSAADLFRDTNPDSNIDFNGTTGNIKRGQVTGGVATGEWVTNANNMNTPRFMGAATIYDDYAYVAGGVGANSTSNLSSVEYAPVKAGKTTGAWVTTTPLPVALSRFQMVAYNGYMYVIGGATGTNNCATNSSKIYYNRIQSNGQLSANWIDSATTSGTALDEARCGVAATIYNNMLYIAGGRTGTTLNSGVNNALSYAPLKPDGSIGSFTQGPFLTANTYNTDLSLVSYNGYLYASGGVNDCVGSGNIYGCPGSAAVSYIALSASGVPAAAWSITTSITEFSYNYGSIQMAANNGYMYKFGGCNSSIYTTPAHTGFCRSNSYDVHISMAQINADGTLGPWRTLGSEVASEYGGGTNLVFWRNTMYTLTGCGGGSDTAGTCTTIRPDTVKYNTIASPGQIGSNTTATNNYTNGRYEHATAVVNGYLYVIGGCVRSGTAGTSWSCEVNAASTTSSTYYAPLATDGSVGAWTLDTRTGFNNANNGGAAMGVAVYNNYIYLIGGYTDTQGAYANVYYAQSTSTGALAANWAATTSIVNAAGTTTAKYGLSAVAYQGYVYALGGCSNTAGSTGCAPTSYVTTVQRAVVNANGTLGTWTTTGQTQLPAGRALTGLAIYNNYVYLAGGGTQANGGQDSGILYNNFTTAGITGTWRTATGKMTSDGTTTATSEMKLRRTDAYAMNGFLYVVGGHNGDSASSQFGTHGEVQIGKINLSTGNVTGLDGAVNLAPSVTTATPRWDSRVAFSNSYMYITGGCTAGPPPNTCTNAPPLIESVEIYNAGNKNGGTWRNGNSDSATGQNTYGEGATAYNGYLYRVGGCYNSTATETCSSSGTIRNNSRVASLSADGSIGAFAQQTLPGARYANCVAAIGGYLYSVGGFTTGGAGTANYYYAPINSDGSLGSWASSTFNTVNVGEGDCATFNGRIYYTGGVPSEVGTPTNRVLVSPDFSGGQVAGTWTSLTGFTTARYQHSALIAGGYLYILGGYSTQVLNSVEYVALDPSTGGLIGSWAYTTDLPVGVVHTFAFAANGYLTLSGGRFAAAFTGWTITASINSTGTTSQWSQSAATMGTSRYYGATAYANGYYYAVGGVKNGNGATVTTANQEIEYNGQQVQAQKAIFSKYADLNGDGTPQKLVIYLTNAVNNGVDIEKWKMSYVSSRESANAWGQATVVSPLLNQNAYSVNAYNGSGTDQKLARWFYLQFSIDMSQSFSFTDETQPNISQYGLHYSPPTSKRLLHGRDFRDQTQQGLDLKL